MVDPHDRAMYLSVLVTSQALQSYRCQQFRQQRRRLQARIRERQRTADARDQGKRTTMDARERALRR